MRVRVAYLISMALGLLAACTAPDPIDVSNPVDFQTQSGVFTIQVPASWLKGQDNIATETVALLNDPARRVGLIAYAGLLERRLGDAEGWKAVSALVKTLVGNPSDFAVGSQQRSPDGAFDMNFAFSAGELKVEGSATFRDTDLALSGVVLTAPADIWDGVQASMQPFVDSFELDAEAVKGTFFEPLQETHFAMAVPGDWEQQRRGQSLRLIARNRDMSMIALQEAVDAPLDSPQLVQQAVDSLRQAFGLRTTVVSSEIAPDGRTKLSLDGGDRRVVGYVQQKGDLLLGLLFDVPADRVDDYQPFIDFEYFTFVTDFEQ